MTGGSSGNPTSTYALFRPKPVVSSRSEIWFSIMSQAVPEGAIGTHVRKIRQAIDNFIEVYNPEDAPFECTKGCVHQVPFRDHYADLHN